MHYVNRLHLPVRRNPHFSLRIVTMVALFFVICQTTVALAQITGKDLSAPNLTDDERKQATLLWLDKYLTDSALMSKEDTGKIRDAVAQMTPSQLEGWLKQTRELVDYVESPQWQDTKRWLRSFLKVQAIYSDKEIEQFRKDVFNADADQMLGILKRIRAKHESLIRMHQAADQSRAVEVQQRNSAVAQQSAMAAQARSAKSRSSSMPLFGSGVAKSQKPSKGYRPPGPLITSREVARATVWREAMGGGGWGYGF